MFTGDMRDGVTYEMRPGVERDRYASPNELVWRYLPLDRFEESLRTGTLFFTRLSHYAVHGDRREGSSPLPFAKIQEEVLRGRGVDIDEYNREAEAFHIRMLQTVLVNCWHKREHESEPMWERYSKGEDAIAIVSTLDRLIESMPDAVTVGHVDYIDFLTESSYYANPMARAFVKSRTLEDEREVRAVLIEPPTVVANRWSITIPAGAEIGHPVAVNLPTLVGRVVLSPSSLSSRDHVTRILLTAGIAVPVEDSEITIPPRY
jgi:hypothetical protein